MQPYRWLDYALSASIMQVVIQVLCGFTDVWTLTLCAVAIATTQLFGYTVEQYLFFRKYYEEKEEKTNNNEMHFVDKYQLFIFGFVSFTTPWVAVYWSFFDSVGRAKPGPPDWVKGVVFSLLVFFLCFAGVMRYFIRNYDEPYVAYKAELGYTFFSIVAKAALAWQLYYGAYGRQDRELKAYNPANVTGL